MRHFEQFDAAATQELFAIAPEQLGGDASATERGRWLGATLYMPGGRSTLVADLVRQRAAGVITVVIDFEDSMPDSLAETAPAAAAAILDMLEAESRPLPMVFLRMRSAADIVAVAAALAGAGTRLTGFVFPKFDPLERGEGYLDALAEVTVRLGRPVFGMPIIESPAFAYRETRAIRLEAARELLSRRPEGIACVRIGGTDIAGAFGLRRTADTTVYDIKVVADVIADIANAFVRSTGGDIPVSAPVWEHFSPRGRFLKPRLRETPFVKHDATSIRRDLVASGLDTLLSEINLDKLNGMSGKTVIHPSHVPLVHSLSVVTREEYEDAESIIARQLDGGVLRSPSGNKMNEVRPHAAWAHRVLQRSRVFGVARAEIDFVDFLVAAGNAAP